MGITPAQIRAVLWNPREFGNQFFLNFQASTDGFLGLGGSAGVAEHDTEMVQRLGKRPSVFGLVGKLGTEFFESFDRLSEGFFGLHRLAEPFLDVGHAPVSLSGLPAEYRVITSLTREFLV